MGINDFLYYLLVLIRDGHKWQRTDINGQQKRRWLYFSILQFIALGISALYVIHKKVGIDHDTIDYLLSSMSIMAGLFLALVVLVLEKSEKNNYEADNQNEQSKKLKLWRFNRQFVTLTSYAILISLLEVSILMGILFFDQGINLNHYEFLPIDEWNATSVLMALKLFFVIVVRICVVYFLFNFILLSVNAVTCIYQSIVITMDERKPRYQENSVEDIKNAFRRKGIRRFPILAISIVVLLMLLLYMFS